MFLLLPLYADWDDHDLTLVATGLSSQENASKFEVKDADGRTFFVNSPNEPGGADIKKIVKFKNEIFAWKQVEVKELSFYMYEKGIQAVVVPATVHYNGIDLKPNLPAGFTFVEGKDGMDYRYRIIVGNTSLKLDGTYKGEDPLLEEMHNYIRGISQGKIIVEDEKVVSGSVVSISHEKNKGEKQVHPIGDLPDLDKKEEEAPEEVGRFKLGNWPALVTVNAGEVWPLAHFSEMVNTGFGGTFSFKVLDVFVKNTEAALEAGVYYMPGKFSMTEENQDTDYALFMPMHLYGGYRFKVSDRLTLGPFITLGLVYYHMEYTSRNQATYVMEEKTVDELGPAVTGGFFIQHKLSDTLYASFRCSFGYLIASDLGLYVVTDVGVLYRL